ncbi:hypothetical protein EJ06DRAFT_534005 [Trichodelitschia bisporula]|uniref:Uncharacterized protein n=1 Tax=Trichodelitschia bisporula TaxID=703511 RepID=A0A6G1HK82_9PEZI|nr:hypothetical protein EJ06DRAFT_534005 [Trichodelitschia bisporula]
MWLLECTLSALGLLNQLHSSQSINLNSNNHTSKKWQRTYTIIKYLMSSKERQARLTHSRPTPKAVDSDELRAERLREQEEIFDYLCTSG